MMCQRYLTNVNTAVKEQVKEQHIFLSFWCNKCTGEAPVHTTVRFTVVVFVSHTGIYHPL